jgi:hypothetical protein
MGAGSGLRCATLPILFYASLVAFSLLLVACASGASCMVAPLSLHFAGILSDYQCLVGLSALWLFHCRFECRRMRLKFFAQFVKMLPTTQCRQRIRRIACLCMCAQLFSGMLLWVPSCAVLDCTYFQGLRPIVKICFFSCWSRDATFLHAYCIWKDLSFNKEVRTFFPQNV